MTIPVQSPRSGPYLGDGGTVAFAYNFLIDEDTELVVVVKDTSDVETIKTITVDYTVSGVGSASGGDVEFVVAPAAGEVVGLYRATELAQGLDLQNRAVVTPQLLEDAYDELTKITQDINERSTRSLKVAITDIGTFTGDAVLPPAAPLATITWNAAGDGFENGPTSEEVENAEANAASALASKQAAAISETNAAASETAAGLSEAGAEAAKADAEAAATASNISAVAAAASESAAAASELVTAADVVQSGLNASGASVSESNAAASAAAALASENAADASESAAALSETNAGVSETNAAASAVLAATFDPALFVAKAGDTMTGVLTNTAGVNSAGTRESAAIGIESFKPTILLKDKSTSSSDYVMQLDNEILSFYSIPSANDEVTAGTLSARMEVAGTSSPTAQSVITREKGDTRYAQLGAANTFTAGFFQVGTRLSAGLSIENFKPAFLFKDTSGTLDFVMQVDNDILSIYSIPEADGDSTTGTLAARVDVAGTSVPAGTTVITREKGDARYTLAGAGGGWELITTIQPVSDVASVEHVFGEGYRSIRVQGVVGMTAASADMDVEIRDGTGSWRKVAETDTTGTGTGRTLFFDFQISNLQDAAGSPIVHASGISSGNNVFFSSIGTNIDATSPTGMFGFSGDASAVFDTVRLTPNTGNIEGSSSTSRGIIIIEGILA